MTAHSPLPFRLNENGILIFARNHDAVAMCGPVEVANSSHIGWPIDPAVQRENAGNLVLASNSHAHLLASLKVVLAWIDTLPTINETAQPAIDAAHAAVTRATA